MLKATTTEIVIHSGYDESMLQETTTVNLVDEGAGRFISLTQYDDTYKKSVIRLDPNEISILFNTINSLLNQ